MKLNARNMAVNKYGSLLYNSLDGAESAQDRIKSLIREARNNPVTVANRRRKEAAKKAAAKQGKVFNEVALQIMESKKEALREFVASKGIAPFEDTPALAMQAWLLRSADADAIADAVGIPKDAAFIALEEAEATLQNNGSADAFEGGDIWGILGTVASTGLDKWTAANEDKDTFWSRLLTSVNSAVQSGNISIPNPFPTNTGSSSGSSSSSSGSSSGLADFAAEAIERIKAEEKRKEIAKMMPWIIAGLILLVFVVYKIARRK